jgi:hypothetical protein
VTHLSTGRYQITFTVPFQSTPTMIATKIFGNPAVNAGTGVQTGEITVDQITTTLAVVAVGNVDGVLTDSAFGFLAIGDVP